ncbi:carotenoid oxygenase family protein [Pleionea sp. CnH1-48]|uniref:carotenoid oxygenase family protein n=1 Tax=Pleionea sp. CnH1-48 TaxID=2954494 RepID=UPI0020976D59|nr:carotenoid oxygenase family protein [Pleionea sp. CnH1-48]MCO7224137.1 carotenoid oxygenase family protein [Pleionea sp. CnH1-48]
MKRRGFIKAAGLVSTIPGVTLSREVSAASSSSFPDSIMYGDFSATSGTLNVIQGQLPSDLYGHVLMAEGIPLDRNHLTPNGRGAISRIDFQNNDVHFTRKMIDTHSALMQDKVSGLFDRFHLMGGMIYVSPNLGFMNYCNTAPNYMGDNRFALSYEGGVPYEFDAHSLELISPIGEPDEWKTSLPPAADFFAPDKWLFPQVRTTGHPFFDLETGNCITINYGGNVGTTGLRNSFIRLIQWDRLGRFKSWNIVDRQGNNAFLVATSHSLGVTRNHILVFETAARVENTRLLGTHIVVPQQHRTPVWVIRKADLIHGRENVVADYLELDFDTSDIMCNYDDSGDEITLYGQYLGAMDKSEPQYFWERLQFGGRVDSGIAGYPVAPVDVGGLVRARIQVLPDRVREITSDFKLIRDQHLLWDMNDPAYRGHFQFPESFEHIYWSAIGYRPEHLVRRVAYAYRNYPGRLFTNDDLPQQSIPSALVHMDCRTMTISDSYQFPEDCVMRTPQFMPRRGSSAQDDGYIFTAVVRKHPSGETSNGKECWLFDAANLSQGPVCILANDHWNFATTNHALWTESVTPQWNYPYKANYADHFREKMPCHSRKVREAVESHILPRFS